MLSRIGAQAPAADGATGAFSVEVLSAPVGSGPG